VKTFIAKNETATHDWYLIDAENKVLGRLATQIALRLRGKHKPIFTPHVDTGDCIVVINAAKVRLTGRKLQNKLYYRHTGYPGGLRSKSAEQLLSQKPCELLRMAVRGMLPKNTLGRKMLKKLKIYSEGSHPHEAQRPAVMALNLKGM